MASLRIGTFVRLGLCALFLALGVSGAAWAGEPPAKAVSKATAAYSAVVARLKDASGANLPRLATAADATHLRSIYDLDAAVAIRPVAGDQLQTLLQWSQVAGDTNRAYIYARGATDNQAIEANVTQFADEISLGTVFNFRVSVSLLQSAQAFLAALPGKEGQSQARQAGYKQMVQGIFQQVSGMMTMEFSGTPMSPGSDVRAAAALAQDMPIVAKSFDEAQRAELIQQFGKLIAASNNPQVSKDLVTALSALQS